MTDRAVLLSIKPKYCELIANSKKTIEAKRTDPETVSFTDYLADYLLEHGVTVTEEAERALKEWKK